MFQYFVKILCTAYPRLLNISFALSNGDFNAYKLLYGHCLMSELCENWRAHSRSFPPFRDLPKTFCANRTHGHERIITKGIFIYRNFQAFQWQYH